ncbi:MAG: AI-2E family transporter [Candidatus Pacebacteria bacterium]|nr:AI-2E family transporter [Candidatus Paceibacterota bacterium]
MSEAKLEGYFFVALFVSILAIVGYIFAPFFGSIATAVVLSTLVYPLYERFAKWSKQPGFAALLLTSMVTLAILLPAAGVFFLMIGEVQGITQAISTNELFELPQGLTAFTERVVQAIPALALIEYATLMEHAIGAIGAGVGNLVTGTADMVFKLFITILALFYLLRDGKYFLFGLIKLSPLTDDEDVLIVNKLKTVSVSLIRGTLVVSVLQGLLTGIGLALFGVPNPVLWGSVAAVCALIPTIGIGIVTLPAIVYLFATGDIVAALGFTAWAALFAGTIDNILGPKLIGNGAKMHPLFVLLSVLGGLLAFGPAGFLIGPLLFGLLVALSEIYMVKVKMLHSLSARVE